MKLDRLFLTAIIAPTVFMVIVIMASFVPHRYGLLSHSSEHIALAVTTVTGVLPFSIFMFRGIRRIQEQIRRQNEDLSRRAKDMETLLKVSRAVATSLDLDRIIPSAVEAILKTTSVDAVEVWLLDPQQNVLFLRHHAGLARDAFREFTCSQLGEDYPGIVAQSGEPILVHNLAGDSRFLRQAIKAAGFSTYYALPLRRAGERPNGVLGVAARDPQAITNDSDIRLLKLMADQVAAAVENARLHEEVRTMAVHGERERIAREMHDGLAQVLGYVSTKAQAVKELLRSGKVEAAAHQIEQLEAAAQHSYDDVREAILSLGTTGKNQSLVESLRAYLQRFGELSGLPTELVAEGVAYPFGPRTELQLFRIVQEALANVRKYAQASRVRLLLSFGSERCRLVVEDDGRGFDPDHVARGPWPHLGLQSMRERAAAIGARLTLDTAPGRGTRVILEAPRGVAVDSSN